MVNAAAATARVQLTSCQRRALDMLEREGNVFLTGAAGTGKSFLLEQYLAGKPAEQFPVVASTGAAAVLVGGRTFHSFFGLGIMEGGVDATVARALRSRKLVYRLLTAACVIIDEVSMLSGGTLAAADRIARAARNRDEPWGGLRIIAVGDFAQLPPVTTGTQQKDWAFLHQTWRESAFQPAVLSTVMRTQESAFLDVLNRVRIGTVDDTVSAFLDARTIAFGDEPEGTRLYAHRSSADNYNLRRLLDTPGMEQCFPTLYEGQPQAVEAAKRAVPVPELLQLKEGALVMLRKNDASEQRLYVNGSLGRVADIGEDLLTVTLLDGTTIDVERQKFTYLNGDGLEVAAAWNFPVTLAWATTIHKAQGASVDALIADLGALWEPGQAYVALSRVRSARGVHLERWTPQCIRAEPLVTELYDDLTAQTMAYVPRLPFAPRSPQREPVDAEQDDLSAPAGGKRHAASARHKRATLIRALLEQRQPLHRIAQACDITPERVLTYIDGFIAEGREVSVGYLLDDMKEDVDVLRSTLRQHDMRLTQAYRALNGNASRLALRLVRCHMAANPED